MGALYGRTVVIRGIDVKELSHSVNESAGKFGKKPAECRRRFLWTGWELHIDILPHNHPIPIILKSERIFFCQQFFTPPDHDFTKNLRPTVGRRAKK